MEYINISSKLFRIDTTKKEHPRFRMLLDSFDLAVRNNRLREGQIILASDESYIFLLFDPKDPDKCLTLDEEVSHERIDELETRHRNQSILSRVFTLENEEKVFFLYFLSDNEATIRESHEIDRLISIMRDSYALARHYATEGEFLKNALNSVADAINIANSDGVIIYTNEGAKKMFDMGEDAFVGKHLDYVLPAGNSLLMKVLRSKQPILDYEYQVDFYGKLRSLTNSGWPIFAEDGELVGAIDIYRSTERSRQLIASLAGYKPVITFNEIITRDSKMLEIINMAKLFAKSNETVLILGESGTGKELIAQSIHNHSNRKDAPFVAINCANFIGELIDSELFGYESGAFTGADRKGKQGKFEFANGGTLFLDEIGEMQMHLQAKLLRVLETMTITKIGGNTPININVRIITATNRDLMKRVAEGLFRSDLYYRLRVLSIELPPLCERKCDIPLLFRHFADKSTERLGKGKIEITDDAMELLCNYSWPGNIRELENTISRMIIICEDNLIDSTTVLKVGISNEKPAYTHAPDDFTYHDFTLQSSRPQIPIKKRKVDPSSITSDHLTRIYNEANGNKKRTAELLGISRPTLYKLLKEFGLSE